MNTYLYTHTHTYIIYIHTNIQSFEWTSIFKYSYPKEAHLEGKVHRFMSL